MSIISSICILGAVVLFLAWFTAYQYRCGVRDFDQQSGTSTDPDDLPGPWRDP